MTLSIIIVIVIIVGFGLFLLNNGITGANFDSCDVFVITNTGTKKITPENFQNYEYDEINFVGWKCDEYRELYK